MATSPRKKMAGGKLSSTLFFVKPNNNEVTMRILLTSRQRLIGHFTLKLITTVLSLNLLFFEHCPCTRSLILRTNKRIL